MRITIRSSRTQCQAFGLSLRRLAPTLAIMNILAFSVILFAIFPSFALAQSHCRTGETDYFSCKVNGNKKVISVCGNVSHNEASVEGWIQYRFGNIGRPEFIYPASKAGSLLKFEGAYFNRYNIASLRFISNGVLYDVSLSAGRMEEDTKMEIRPSGGVSVSLDKKTDRNINCAAVNVKKYFRIFSELVPAAGPFDGKKDILYYYYNEVAK